MQQAWENANRDAHTALLSAIQSNAAEQGVSLDLGTIVGEVGQEAGLGNVSTSCPRTPARS